VGPSATPVYPKINVWIRAGETFSVGVPTSRWIDDVVVEGKIVGLGKASEMTFGEVVDDLLLLSRRAVFINSVNFVDSAMMISAQPFIPNSSHQGPVFIDTSQYMSFGTYLSTAFLGESGGWCYKLVHDFYVPGVKDITTAYQSLESAFATEGSSGKGTILLDGQEEKIIEVRVPDRNPYSFRYTGSIYDGSSQYETVVMTSSADSESEVSTTIYQAHADDYRIGGFLCAPPYALRV